MAGRISVGRWLAATTFALLATGCDFDTPSRAGSGHVSNPPIPPKSAEAVAAEEQLDRGMKAWESMVTQAQPLPAPADWTNSAPSAEVLESWKKTNGERALTAADMAREFGKNYPEHPMAEKAPDLELKFLQIAAEHGVTLSEERVRELENKLVADNPDLLFELRVKGAIRAAESKKRPEDDSLMLDEMERQARILMAEFPGKSEVYDLLLAAAQGLVSEIEPDLEKTTKGVRLLDEIIAGDAAEGTKQSARELKAKGEQGLKELAAVNKEREAVRAGESTEIGAARAKELPPAASFEDLRKSPVGKRLELTFTAFDGRKIDLAKLRGKVVLIDFWASWCGPCLEEIPAMRKAYAKHKDAGFEILGLSLDSKKLAFQRAVGEEGITWPVSFDEGGWISKLTDNLGIEGIPAMWVVDRSGLISNVNAAEGPEEAIEAAMKAE